MKENNIKYEKGTLGWIRERQKINSNRDGFDNIDEWLRWKRDSINVLENKYGKDFADWARANNGKIPKYFINAGCKTDAEYRNYCAKNAGFDNDKDRRNIRDWSNNKRLPKHITPKIEKLLNNNLIEYIKEKISNKKEMERIAWSKSIEDKYGKDFYEYAKKNEHILQRCVLDAGCRTENEYANLCAQRIGFKDSSEQSKVNLWKRGKVRPMSQNKDCSSYLGIELGEKIIGRYSLPILFDNIIKEMPNNCPGYEFIVIGDFKVNIKCRCLQFQGERTPFWNFSIRYNKVTDYFLLIGFDSRKNLEPKYAWLIHKNELVKIGKDHKNIRPLWNRDGLVITNANEYLKYFKKYNVTDKLKDLKDICKDFMENIDES